MEITVARKHLEEMRDDLDRSISILQGERPAPLDGAGYPADSADAGSTLSEADRTEAILHSARGQRVEVLAALVDWDGERATLSDALANNPGPTSTKGSGTYDSLTGNPLTR